MATGPFGTEREIVATSICSHHKHQYLAMMTKRLLNGPGVSRIGIR